MDAKPKRKSSKFEELAAAWARVGVPATLTQLDAHTALATLPDGTTIHYDIAKAIDGLRWARSGKAPWGDLVDAGAVSKKHPIGPLSPAWKFALVIFAQDVPDSPSPINAIAFAFPSVGVRWATVGRTELRRLVHRLGIPWKNFSSLDGYDYDSFMATRILRRFVFENGEYREVTR